MGPRAKSRVHGTSPWYTRQRRARAGTLARAEKQEERRTRKAQRPEDVVEHLALALIVRKALGHTGRHLPFITINWRTPKW